jgi:UDP-N-acetylglucosamine:LPS N-acetylglucosamine transferase
MKVRMQHHARHAVDAMRRAARRARLRQRTLRTADHVLIGVGLDPARPIGIVMFGGHGSAAMQTIAAQLRDVQLILICGHNEALAGQLRQAAGDAPHAVLGFTSQVRRYMQLGDFFIGKPGPGSLSEAVHLGLPVITFRNAWTMPQERYNTEWVREQRLGLVVPSARAIRPAVLELLADAESFRANVRRLRNRAVFEVPEVLATVLAQSPGARCPPLAQSLAA